MAEKTNDKIYPYLGDVSEARSYFKGSFALSSPWKKANTSFYWMNFEYPLYHGHQDWELLIILNDCIVQKINGTEQTLMKGTACLVGPKDDHALFFPHRVKNQFQGLTLLAKDSYLKSLLAHYSPTLYEELLHDPNPLYFTLSPNALEQYTNTCLEIQAKENESTPYIEQQCNILFSKILLKFLEQRQGEMEIPTVLKTFIRQLNNPLITPEEIKAAQSAMPYSYPQLTRIFKKYMSCTITQYVNRRKLEHAKELLSNTDMSLSEITSQLNFESTSHFHSLFKKHYGVTPSEHRKLSLSPHEE
jgi:AraC-like DNA-binding protein